VRRAPPTNIRTYYHCNEKSDARDAIPAVHDAPSTVFQRRLGLISMNLAGMIRPMAVALHDSISIQALKPFLGNGTFHYSPS
jgi:hypothetical protein